MTTECPSKEHPVIKLALADKQLRTELTEKLEQHDAEVRGVLPMSTVWGEAEEAGGGDVDLLVIERKLLRSAPRGLIQRWTRMDGRPGVVLLERGVGALERAELLGEGVLRILDPGEGSEQLAQSLQTLGEAQAAGSADREAPDSDGQPMLADFLSRSPYMRRFLDMVRKVSSADASLLITGETGVGKERLARAIHAQSPRCEEAFVGVNCGALPESLLESELFGHEKGSFTGASAKRIGRFEQAQGGTVFLDEIGEMPAHLQVKLLTVLQRRRIQRVGGSEEIALDVRVMAATNRAVQAEVASGKFREDLYYRLNVVPLEIPALRERREDLPDLLGALLNYFAERTPGTGLKSVEQAAMDALLRHSWPGNVRELINVVERATLLCDGEELTLDLLPPELSRLVDGATMDAGRTANWLPEMPEEWCLLPIAELRERVVGWAERRYLERHLQETRGHVGQTAARAGISTRALYDRMKQHSLSKEDYR